MNSRSSEGSKASPFGSTRPARSDGPPSPLNTPDPSPAKVETTPVVSITRTRRFSLSAKNTRPERSMTTPYGSFNRARVAGSPSPE